MVLSALSACGDGGDSDTPGPRPNNQRPEAVLRGPDSARLGEPITLDASESFDPDGAIEAYLFEISLANDPPDEVLQSSSPRLIHTFDVAGQWAVILTVVDDDGTKTSAPELIVDVQ